MFTARNKYPEETVEKIVNAATRLFVQDGYEHTSVQDIINELGGLTKGAIYHHFKSKEEIMMAVLDKRFGDYDAKWLRAIKNDAGKTGLQKLRDIFMASLSNPAQGDTFRSAPNMLKSPKMLAAMMEGIVEESAPDYVQPLIEQGVADGSIKTEYPKQLAEVMLILINIWVSPMVFAASKEEVRQRALFFKQLMLGLGVDFVDDEMMARFMELTESYSKNA